MTFDFDPVAFAIAAGYTAVVVMVFRCRHAIPKRVKPIGPLVLTQLTVWILFYGSTALTNIAGARDFYIWMSRFGHFLDISFMALLVLFLIRIGQGAE